MLVSVLIGLAAAASTTGVVAKWGGEAKRSRMLDLVWAAIFLYPVVFTVMDARSVYLGASARLVDDRVFAAVNAAWSTFTILVCAVLVIGLLLRARVEVLQRIATMPALAMTLGLFLGTMATLAAASGSVNRFLGVGLVGSVLFAILVAGESHKSLLARLVVAGRLLVGGSLACALVFPGWSFVPYGHGGRELFGIGSRLIGLTPSPNYLGILAAIAVYAEFARSRDADRRLSVPWVVLSVVVCLWAQSRTAYLVLALLLLFFAGRNIKKLVLWSKVRVSILVGLFAVSMLVPLALGFSSIAGSSTVDQLLTGRFGAWQAALAAFADHPLVGYGPDAFGEGFWDVYGTVGGQTYANGHNAWLDVMATAGVLGGLTLLVFALSLLRQSAVLHGQDVTLGAIVLVVAQMPLGTPFRLQGLSSNLITVAVVVAVVAASTTRDAAAGAVLDRQGIEESN